MTIHQHTSLSLRPRSWFNGLQFDPSSIYKCSHKWGIGVDEKLM